MTKSYEDLIVWERSIDLVHRIHTTLRGFPRSETFALSDQLRRSVISIPANIAEGQARQHTKEFLQHLAIARGSLAEVHTLLVIAERLGYISESILSELLEEIVEIRKLLAGLVNSLRKRISATS